MTTTQTPTDATFAGRAAALLRRTKADYAAAVTFVRMTFRARSLRKQSGSAQGDLALVFREAGQRGEELNVAAELPTADVVRDCRTRLNAAQATLVEKEASLRAAEETLAVETSRHEGIIGELKTEHRRLEDAAKAARDAVTAIERRISQIGKESQKLQSAIDGATTGKPPAEPVDQLRARLASLAGERSREESRRPDAEAARTQAEAAASGKERELAAAKQAWNQANAQLNAGRDAAQEARATAATSVEAVTRLLAEAHEAFGRAIHVSGSTPAELAEVLGRARQIEGTIGQFDADRAAALSQRDAVRREAMRFGMVAGGALLALVVLIGLVAMLTRTGDGPVADAKPAAPPPAQPAAPGDATTPAPMPAHAPAMTPALQEAIRQTPALAATFFDEQRQQPKFAPGGKVVIEQAIARPDGTHLLQIAADAQSRPEPDAAPVPLTVILEAVVNSEGAVLSSRLVRIVDPEMKELETLLAN